MSTLASNYSAKKIISTLVLESSFKQFQKAGYFAARVAIFSIPFLVAGLGIQACVSLNFLQKLFSKRRFSRDLNLFYNGHKRFFKYSCASFERVNPCGESDQLVVHLVSLKWLSEAKQKARSEASRQKSKFEIF